MNYEKLVVEKIFKNWSKVCVSKKPRYRKIIAESDSEDEIETPHYYPPSEMEDSSNRSGNPEQIRIYIGSLVVWGNCDYKKHTRNTHAHFILTSVDQKQSSCRLQENQNIILLLMNKYAIMFRYCRIKLLNRR
jgi:hypothetical protein